MLLAMELEQQIKIPWSSSVDHCGQARRRRNGRSRSCHEGDATDGRGIILLVGPCRKRGTCCLDIQKFYLLPLIGEEIPPTRERIESLARAATRNERRLEHHIVVVPVERQGLPVRIYARAILRGTSRVKRKGP